MSNKCLSSYNKIPKPNVDDNIFVSDRGMFVLGLTRALSANAIDAKPNSKMSSANWRPCCFEQCVENKKESNF